MAEALTDRSAERQLREHTSTGSGWLEIIVVSLGAFVVSLSQALLVPVLPILPHKLHTSAGTVEWLLTSTLLVGAVAVPVFGRLGDMFGKRLMLMVTLGFLTVGSLLDALTSNVPLLIVGRALQGVSLSAIPLGISLLSSVLPRERVHSANALVSAMLGVGGALGLPLAGLVGEHLDFHVLFWITAVAGALSLVGTVAFCRESPIRSGGRLDAVGTVLVTGGLVALLLPLAQGSAWGWTSASTLGLLVLAVVVLGLFILFERRQFAPLVDIAVSSRRPIVLTNLASLLFGFALFAGLIGSASYVEAPRASGYGFGSSIVVGGLTLLPAGLLVLLLSLTVAARLIGSLGPHRTLALGALVVAAGWAVRIFATGSLWEVIVGSTLVGAGTGIGYAAMPTLINANVPVSQIAAANGLNSLCRSLGSSLASAIGGSLLTASTIAVAGSELPSLSCLPVPVRDLRRRGGFGRRGRAVHSARGSRSTC